MRRPTATAPALARGPSRRACLLALGLALLAPGARAAEPPVTLPQLMAAFRTVRHVEARYVERRTVSALRTPIETTGTLRFDAPDRLEKLADPGPNRPGERVTIAGDRLTIERGDGAAPLVVSLSARPEIGVLVESIRATLSGDGAALDRAFGMTLAGTIDGWQMVLQPRDPTLRAILDWMRIDGRGPHVTAIETQDGEGDRSQMAINERAP